MKKPVVNERDCINNTIAVVSCLHAWQTCDIADDEKTFNVFLESAVTLVSNLKSFRKQQYVGGV